MLGVLRCLWFFLLWECQPVRDLWIHRWPLSIAQKSVWTWTLWHCSSSRRRLELQPSQCAFVMGWLSWVRVYIRNELSWLRVAQVQSQPGCLALLRSAVYLRQECFISDHHLFIPHLTSNYPLFWNRTPAEEHYPLMARWNWCWCKTFLVAVVQSEAGIKGKNS